MATFPQGENIRIFSDSNVPTIFVSRGLIGPWPVDCLKAISDLNPDTLSIRNLAKVYPDGEDFFEITLTDWQLFIDENDQQWGTDRNSTVNNLNALFSDTGRFAPVIDSSLSIDSTAGDSVNYFMTADQGVSFEWGNIPRGMSIANGNPRNLIGVALDGVGVYNIDMVAANYYGSDNEILVLNVTGAPFVNTKSLRFENGGYCVGVGGTTIAFPLFRSDDGSGSSEAWTISFWIKPSSPQANEQTVLFSGSSSVSTRVLLDTSSKLHFSYGRPTGAVETLDFTSSATLVSDVWYNVIITYDGGTTGDGGALAQSRFHIYINSIEDTGSWTGDGYPNTMPATAFQLGKDGFSFPGSFLTGEALLEEVAVFDAAVDSEVANIYNAGTPQNLNSLATPPQLWWRMGDGDTYPILSNNGVGPSDMTMTDMLVSDIVNEVP